jgi:hypothetical protein
MYLHDRLHSQGCTCVPCPLRYKRP